LAFSGIASAQTETKPNPSDYPVHADVAHATIAAEYLVHSIPTEQMMIATSDYLVIEVAFFGPKKQPIKISADDFELIVNHKKQAVSTEAPEFVANSIRNPDYAQQRPGLTVDAGAGPVDVGLGHPAPTSRFPDDPNGPNTPRTGKGPGGPNAPDPNGAGAEAPLTIEERVNRASLPLGEQLPPVSGVLFFRYAGKLKSLRSLELHYHGPAGETTLKLL